MSKIVELREQLQQLLLQLETAENNYQAAHRMYELVLPYEQAAQLPQELLVQLNITAEIQGQVTFLPAPPPATLLDQLAVATAQGADDILNLWRQVSLVTETSIAYQEEQAKAAAKVAQPQAS